MIFKVLFKLGMLLASKEEKQVAEGREMQGN